ncbi:PTS sugar transporter subunit IIB [Paenibacillus sp. GM2]|uniref:PTS sugar transporter subunit IIB n=1 Tax=Paenibacillus sp. GM2 TaxID=1622070 RepID=UPI000838CEA8|nr:PTS sugar transporter subunit IIB [Paenibacillus sp. GM2]
MTKKVLLVCGAGASSGFMAAAARKAVKKTGEEIEFKAKSEAELAENLSTIDLLLVAPHLKYMIEDVKDACEAAGVKYGVIPQKVYGSLDGQGLVNVAKPYLEGGK